MCFCTTTTRTSGSLQGTRLCKVYRVDGLYTGCQESKPRLAPRRCTSTFAATAQKGRKDSLTF